MESRTLTKDGKHPGIIYLTNHKDYAIGYHHEQRKEFLELKKVYIHLFKDSLCTIPKIDKNKQPLKVLKSKTLLRPVGFID